MNKPLSYKDAGVDIDAGDALVERIKPLAKKTLREGVLAGIGGFGALFEVPKRYQEPVLVSGTDGVGTKVAIAQAIDKQRGIEPVKRAPIVHRAVQDTAPLTLMQERIRFIEEMQPGRVVYNAPSAHRLLGPMNLEAFDRAFSAMMRRQPMLRTSIVAADGGYVQHVDDAMKFSLLPAEDLSALEKDAREAKLAQRLEELTAQTFEMNHGPLFKARLFKLGPQEHALFFMPHHIVWDGWSFDILYADISALYEAYAEGKLLAPGNRLARRFSEVAAFITGVEPAREKEKKRFSLFG